jgi:hypothetical protein
MAFKLHENHLRRLCQINCFNIPDEEMILFGLRGCLPADEDNNSFQPEHTVIPAAIDYVHPRCTLVQWFPQKGKIALFPGSTVPHIKHIKISKERNGLGANQLMTGHYKDYRKGIHKQGSQTAHEAFRQTEGHPIRRTADDFDFDTDDCVEFVNPYDNIHAAWCMGVNHDSYASAGCQVIAGYPKCEKRRNRDAQGPWKIFKENAYSLQQVSFPYILLNGRDAEKAALNGSQKISVRLRFGSSGELVTELQKTLQIEGYYEGHADGDFGKRTVRAVLDYQTAEFGPGGDDGIIGPITSSALKIKWLKV